MSRVDSEIVFTPRVDPRGRRRQRDQPMHRVRRLETDRRAPWPAERLQQLLDHFVRAVRRPDLVRREAMSEICRQALAQLDRLTVRIAVQTGTDPGDRGRQFVYECGRRRPWV